MHLSKNKKYLIAGFILLSALFIWLRLKTIGHLLMWDEAWNILSLRAFLQNAVTNPFYWFYKYHPPLYMAFAGLLQPFKSGFDVRLEVLSLIISYGVFLTIYLLSARIGGWRYAWLSGLILSVMPSSIGYDTWIKRDGLASLFGYIALFLVLKRKFIWCGILLALSMLSKENGIFFVFSAVLLIFLLKEKKAFKKIFILCALIFILSSWWYFFFSEMTTHGPGFFFSKEGYSTLWAKPSYYYFKKLLPDMGIGSYLFLLLGVFYLVYQGVLKKQARWLLPVAVAACVYIPISFLFALKTPWLALPAGPALAMIAAGGALCFLRKGRKTKYLLPVLFLLLALTVSSGLSFSYPKYHIKTYPNGWPGAHSSRELAMYLNEHVKENEKLMITEFAYWQMPLCPIFLYYSKPHQVQWIKGNETSDYITKEIIKNDITWLVIVSSPDPKYSLGKLAGELKKTSLGNPKKVGWSFVWKTDALR